MNSVLNTAELIKNEAWRQRQADICELRPARSPVSGERKLGMVSHTGVLECGR